LAIYRSSCLGAIGAGAPWQPGPVPLPQTRSRADRGTWDNCSLQQSRAVGAGDCPCCGITGVATGSWAVGRVLGGLRGGQAGLARPLVPSKS